MKCVQCENKSTKSGSGLCEQCEIEIMEENEQQLKKDLENHQSETIKGIGIYRKE